VWFRNDSDLDVHFKEIWFTSENVIYTDISKQRAVEDRMFEKMVTDPNSLKEAAELELAAHSDTFMSAPIVVPPFRNCHDF